MRWYWAEERCYREMEPPRMRALTVADKERGAKLRETYYYNKQFGIFVRRKSYGRAKVGLIAGTVSSHGYIRMCVNGYQEYAHRLAFLYVTGSFPDKGVDHINGVRTDNRWSNIRDVSQAINCKNASKRKDNVSGVTGVYWDSSRKKWAVQITSGGHTESLGRFDHKIDAINARKAAEPSREFGENHGT